MKRKIEVRDATLCDMAWGMRLAVACYPQYDLNCATAWVTVHVNDKNLRFLRTDHALGIAAVSRKFWTPGATEGSLIAIFTESGHPWDAVAVVRALAAWAKAKGASTFELSSDTASDVSTLAKRLGKTTTITGYIAEI